MNKFESKVLEKLDALLTAQADEMQWLALWSHEYRLTGDARKVVARTLMSASEELRKHIGDI